MEQGSRAIDNEGNIVNIVEVNEIETPPLPEDSVLIGAAYNFEPSNTVFDKAIILTFDYDVTQLPQHTKSVSIAYYLEGLNWIELEPLSGVVAEVGKLTSPVEHFTVFGIIAKIEPATFSMSSLSVIPVISKKWEHITFVEIGGREVNISVEIANIGGLHGSHDIDLLVNGVVAESKVVYLSPDETSKVNFVIKDNTVGTNLVKIGELSGEFETYIRINWLLIGGSIIALAIIGWIIRRMTRLSGKNNHEI
jgi:hypothetical protein